MNSSVGAQMAMHLRSRCHLYTDVMIKGYIKKCRKRQTKVVINKYILLKIYYN